jgi:hypothetical protein
MEHFPHRGSGSGWAFFAAARASGIVMLLCVAGACGGPGDPVDGGDAGDDGGCAACARDAGPDAGPIDAGPIPTCAMPTRPGLLGGLCVDGTTCRGADCFEEVEADVSTDLSLRTGVPDPTHPGECVPGPPIPLPIAFAPGGSCSRPSDPTADDDGCGACAWCSTRVGGSLADALVISVRAFDSRGRIVDPDRGLCRAGCTFDPSGASNGGCEVGYTCDPATNLCLEACVSDIACGVLGYCLGRSDGLLVRADGAATCNSITGRCEWVPPPTAAAGSDCETDTDCPADIGVCLLGGFCSTYQCNLVDPTGTALQLPCADTDVCVGVGGNDAAFCLRRCETPEDCRDGTSCAPLDSSGERVCVGVCSIDAGCKASERCALWDTRVGSCTPYCDPVAGGLPGAVACAADEDCVKAGAAAHGFCEARDRLCYSDDECHGDQACERLGVDRLGRCVDGCLADADCAGFDLRCKVQPESTYGVCRMLGGACRDDAQCPDGQVCDATTPGGLGTCVDGP